MYTRLPNTKKEEVIGGIKCHRIDVPFGRRFFPFASIPRVYRLSKKVDILNFDTFFAGISGWVSGKMSRKPYLLTVYEFFQDLWNIMAKNKMEGWIYRIVEKYLANCPYPLFITISECTKKRLIDLGCDKKIIKVIYPGINHKIFHPNYKPTTRNKFKLGKKFVLGWAGRMNLSQSKNLPALIRAFKIVKEKRPDTVLALAGPDFQNLIPLIKENSLKVGKDVFYAGCLDRTELPSFYSSLDLYVCSSLSEGFGLVVAEAEACGKPVVCFNSGALPEVVKDKKTGIVVKEKTGDALAEAIIELSSDKRRRDKYGKTAVKWSKSFDWEKTVKEYITTYEQLDEKF